MTDIAKEDPDKIISILNSMTSSYRERVPKVYTPAFLSAANRHIGRAKALQYMRSGPHHA